MLSGFPVASLATRLECARRDVTIAPMSPAPGGRALDCLRALRPHHWIKNVLVFAPLVAAHETRPELYALAAGLFAALSACASGAYLLNDLVDLPHDRRHATKRHRPLAAGRITPRTAVVLGAALAAAGLGLALWLSVAAGLWVLLYLAVTTAYSLSLKRHILVDVIALAVLFTVRVVAGGVAAAVPLSPAFLAFSIFVFLALAIVKRLSELQALGAAGLTAAGGRAYAAADLVVLAGLGAASSFAAVTVLMFYLTLPAIVERYARPDLLSLICLLLLYWMGRMLLLANRGAVGADPLVFAMRDGGSWLVGGAMLVTFLCAL